MDSSAGVPSEEPPSGIITTISLFSLTLPGAKNYLYPVSNSIHVFGLLISCGILQCRLSQEVDDFLWIALFPDYGY